MPPPKEALKLNVMDDALRLEISPVMAVELSLSVQTGVFANEFAKFNVHEVTIPLPTVIVPALSVPTNDGLVPQVPMEGVVPEEIM